MPIYNRPTKALIADWAREHLSQGVEFSRVPVQRWFQEHYPKIKKNTVAMHVEAMSVNNRNRRHHPNVRPGSGHDLFFKLGSDRYRLWNPEDDGEPLYKDTIEQLVEPESAVGANPDDNAISEAAGAAQTFAFERDLQSYLVKNLAAVEPGLKLYEDEGITGVEFPVGGRFIDILAIDENGDLVVFELKVSRGYDRVVGQLLRYMSWIEQNLADKRKVRGFIVASEITSDLKLAAARIPDVQLIEYEISFRLRPII